MNKRSAQLALVACCAWLIGASGEPKALELAGQVVKASGGEHWAQVKRIRFTFNVAGADGKSVLSAAHDWDLKAKTDAVTVAGKTTTVNLASPGSDEESKKAYQRWVNDSYWLLAPLKLEDDGVKLSHKGTQAVDGKPTEVLHLAFEGVGLTPGDQYNFYIDPSTKLPVRWDYIPQPEKTVSGTWEGYKKFGPLTLATDHTFGERRITFTDVSVE